ncbi:MAG: DUF438 domain-containing protein [Clostridiales bacterium]|nr:DUF438 domain-containing protein [Clostridiales bacterium]
MDAQRIDKLTEYVQGVLDGKDGTMLYKKYYDDIEKVTPGETFEVFFQHLKRGLMPKDILKILDKVIHVFNISLSEFSWDKPLKDSFPDTLMKENRALVNKLENIKEIIKRKDFKNNKTELLKRIEELQDFNPHYLKKENILFPYLEKKMEKFEGLKIMWSLHDEARAALKETIDSLRPDETDETKFNIAVGNLFFILYGLVYKEEMILLPAAMEVIKEEEWISMKEQSYEYAFPFIDKPQNIEKDEKVGDITVKEGETFIIKSETGELSFEQVLLLFNSLPVDLSYVDENNKLKFFTRPKDRIFPRSPASIGRNVENCHPAESVHVVSEIIEEFRQGRKDEATFWIQMKEKTILIQYFAVRNSPGEYKGVLEVSQDITGIKKLEGERRLLQWK